MLFRGIAECAANEVAEPALPVVLPQIQRQSFGGGSAQAIQGDRGKHSRSIGIELGNAAVSEVVSPPCPGEPGCRTREPVKNDAVAGRGFLEKPLYEDFAGCCAL